MNKIDKISDIKCGMLLEIQDKTTNNTSLSLVLTNARGIMIFSGPDYYGYLNNFNSNFETIRYKIIKVYSCSAFNDIAYKLSCEDREIIWSSENIDWSKVEVDTPIYVGDTPSDVTAARHFAKYENGRIYAWNNGTTSFTATGSKTTSSWCYARLAKAEE